MSVLYKIYYHMKKNALRYISFLFSFVLILTGFYFFAPNIIVSKTNYDLYTSSSINEVWFAETPVEKDCFIDLNGSTFMCINNKSINADLFMQMEDVQYQDNLFDIKCALEKNVCAISKNLAIEYGLNIGDVISTSNGQFEFEVSNIFTSQSGIDDKYNHEGIIVLSFDENLIANKTYLYTFFACDGDGYYNVKRVIFLKDRITSYRQEYIKGCFDLTLVMLFIFLLEELFIFRKKENDYLISRQDGTRKKRMLLNIFLDNLIRLFVPVMAILAIYVKYLKLYEVGYAFLVMNFAVCTSLVTIGITLFYFFRRIKK